MSQQFHPCRSVTKQLFLMTIVAASALWSSANAQLPPGVGTGGRRDKSIEDKYRSDEMERLRRDSNTPEYRPATTRFPQVKEDFERIQVINSELFQANNSSAALDHARILEAAGEIKKRATRLKSNLFPSASSARLKEIEKQSKERQDLKSLLTQLDRAITSFVHNPIFENTRLVNPQDSERAERELEKILILSVRTRKKAERRKS